MAPQCGLAPGFICIVGADLAGKFRNLRSIELRVGALPQHPRGLLGYAFNWSPEGVVNEYLNDCEVIKEGKRAKVTSMEGLETIVIDGVPLEAFATSGGLGTMCETYEGKVEHLNYKTIRYPGHCQLMKFFFNELFMRKDRQKAGEILVNAKPPVNDDVVFVHAAVEGSQNGKMMREEFVRSYYPLDIGGQRLASHCLDDRRIRLRSGGPGVTWCASAERIHQAGRYSLSISFSKHPPASIFFLKLQGLSRLPFFSCNKCNATEIVKRVFSRLFIKA